MIKEYSILNDSKYISSDRSQDYLAFQSLSRYFTSKIGKICSGRSEGMSEKSIKPPSTLDNSFDPEIIDDYGHGRVTTFINQFKTR